MIRTNIRGVLRAALALALLALPSAAQVKEGEPIRVKPKIPKVQVLTFKGEVMQMNAAAITVRSRENARMIRTFSFAPKVREQMQKILERGGYHYGDRVEIRYSAGSDVAVEIKGKPSSSR